MNARIIATSLLTPAALVAAPGMAGADNEHPLVTALGISRTITPAGSPEVTVDPLTDPTTGLQTVRRIGWASGEPGGVQACGVVDYLVFQVDASGDRVPVPWTFQRLDWTPKHPDGIELSLGLAPPRNVKQPAGTNLRVNACVKFTVPAAPGGTEDFLPVVK